MISNKPIITKEFESLLDWSKNIDQRVEELQRIAILATRCREEFPEILCTTNPNYSERRKPSQLEQLVDDRKAIRLQKRGNHSHRTQRPPVNDDDEIVDGEYLTSNGYRFSHCLPPGYSKEIKEKFRNGILTKKELRDECARQNKQYEKGCWINAGRHCKKYDPRIDITPPELYQCIMELNWIMKRHSVVIHEVNEPPQKSQVITTILNIAFDQDMYDNENENNMKLDSIVDSFSYYSEEKYHHHPLHNHSRIVTNLRMKVRSIRNDIYKQVNDDVQLDIICKYILESATPSLKALAMEIRGTIIIMQRRSLDHPIPIQNRFMANVQAKIKKIDESIERKQCYVIKTDTGRTELDKKAYIELPDYIEYELIPTLNTLASEIKGSIKQKTYIYQFLENKAYKKTPRLIPKGTVVILQNMPGDSSHLNGKRCFVDNYNRSCGQYTLTDTDKNKGVKSYTVYQSKFRREMICAEEFLRTGGSDQNQCQECSVMEHRLYGRHYKLTPSSENFNSLVKEDSSVLSRTDSSINNVENTLELQKKKGVTHLTSKLDRTMCKVYIDLNEIVSTCESSLIKLRDVSKVHERLFFKGEWNAFVQEVRHGISSIAFGSKTIILPHGGLRRLIHKIGKSMIDEPEETYYSKLHAVKVATTYAKNSKERGNVIRDMVENGWVPSKAAMDKALVLNEEGRLVDDEWNTNRGRQSRPAIMLEEERYCNIMDSNKQPSRARVREERRKMTIHERRVDTWSQKTDSEVEDYLKRRNTTRKV